MIFYIFQYVGDIWMITCVNNAEKIQIISECVYESSLRHSDSYEDSEG